MSDIGINRRISFEDFRNTQGPLIDIRSPGEYLQGHWPSAKNLPLFNNREREAIGYIYKKKGSLEAITQGLKVITPKLSFLKNSAREIQRDSMDSDSLKKSNFLRVYCWRGGLRSKSYVWLLSQLGFNTVQLIGGYKTYRKWVINQFELNWNLNLIGGKTGSGKTEILKSLREKNIQIIDFEGLANHRGSSFGGLGLPKQPSCEHYENLICESLQKSKAKNKDQKIWVEDESPNLGKCRIPNALIKQMKEAPMLEIQKNKNERISELVKIYSSNSQEELKAATLRIQKRLGPQRTKIALEEIQKKNWGGACSIILDYYDRAYQHQLERIPQRKSVDLTGLDYEAAAFKLLEDGYVN